MNPVREAYLRAATSAAALVGDPAVVGAWSAPSALAGFTVGGLAAHLAAQVTYLPRALALPQPEGPPIALLEHYARARWVGADLDAEPNLRVRKGGEEAAAAGARAVAEQAAAALRVLPGLLAQAPDDRLVSPIAGPWVLSLDDFLVTRLMEITVHSDDLAHSVGVPTPDQPSEVLEPVLALLTALAVRRHGQPALIRALARAERAPAHVNAF